MNVFWSWQSDLPYELTKDFIQEALKEALEAVSLDLELSPADRPVLDHDTKGEAGLVEIVNTILKKIESSTVFIADVTPIAQTAKGKKVPNPNVMIELGHALKALGHTAIMLVANTEFGGGPEDLPFDLRHRRGAITFQLSASALGDKKIRAQVKKRFVSSLVSALKTNLSSALARSDHAIEFERKESSNGDPSTWLSHDEQIEFNDFYGGTGAKVVLPVGRTRNYFRISVASWTQQKPTRNQVQTIPAALRLNPLGRWSSWDGGPNKLGWVAAATSRHDTPETTTITQWFDSTAEIWALDSSIVDDIQGRKILGINRVIKDWETMLDKALRFYKHFEASPPFRVEVGLGGLDGVRWPDPLQSRQVLALESSVSSFKVARDWNEDEKIDFLTASAAKVFDAFNQPPPNRESVIQILRSTPM